MAIKMIDNYIYIYHLGNNGGEFVLLPTFPDSIQDTLSSTFTQQNALSRSAPVFSYSNSGPRQVQISLELHRDMFNDLNYNTSNMVVEDFGDDYVDTIIKKLQSIALPKYNAANYSVQPPMVAVRFGNEIFIKGIVNGGITITYNKPLIDDNRKYAIVQIGFTVTEIDPYDATTVANEGSFRGLTRTFKNGIWKAGDY